MHHISITHIGRALAAALAVFLLAGSGAQAVGAPAVDRDWPEPSPNAQPDPFYTPPAVIPDGAPGDVVRARPAKAGPPTARALASAWQVMYLSTDALGQRNVVTGTVLVPRSGSPAAKPLVAFNPGTSGPAFRCAPSRFINSGTFYEQSMVNRLLQAGYAVAVTDYEGYHENPDTTYIVGRSMGPAVLDLVRAATRLPEAGLSATPKVVIHGFSQGGAASMWAGQLEPSYAPEIDLRGVSGGGVPSNLALVALGLNGKKPFGFFLNALIGLDNAYADDLQLATYLNEAGREAVATMESTNCTVNLLLDYQGRSATDYTTSLPFSSMAWLARVNENWLGQSSIEAPVYQYHSPVDEIVDFGQAKQLRDAYCSRGMTVQWKEFSTGHVTTVGRGNADALAFITDRFNGKAPLSNCGA